MFSGFEALISGLFASLLAGLFGWVWRTDRRIAKVETSSAENAKDIKTIAEASGKPSAEVAMLREIVGTMAAQSQQQHNEYREERREMREELRTTWQRIDGLVDTVGQTNKHLARIQGALGT